MSKKLWCTECWNSFRVEDDFDWEKVKCDDCGFEGEVVGRILDEKTHYFQDEGPELLSDSEAETTVMEALDEDEDA